MNTKKIKLSIIIPCYNSERTLVEAVDSCFKQNISIDNFEIIMVDDMSTDSTRELIKDITTKYTNIHHIFHDKNMGGGAARNTGINEAHADIVFCLDSDDMLDAGALQHMLDLMHEKKCDGVGIGRSVRFKGTNLNDIEAILTHGYAGKKIPFEALLERGNVSCSLYSTFMHTKKAFNILGGYPTNHGFDTQSFAWRFLCNGLVAYTCPDATYLHRVQFTQSYYIREQRSGRNNYNWFTLLNEFLYLFNARTKHLILSFDLHSDKNIWNEIQKIDNVFVENYEDYVRHHTREYKKQEIETHYHKKKTVDTYDMFWLGEKYALEMNYDAAYRWFKLAYNNNLIIPKEFLIALRNEAQQPSLSAKAVVEQIMNRYGFKKKSGIFFMTRKAIRKMFKLLTQSYVLLRKKLR